MLVGRDAERQQIARLVAGARLGQSGVLVLRGEAGIGKSALLGDAASQAGDMTVLRMSGSEAETGLAFAGLHQLLQPAQHLIDRIPGPQRDALSVALTLRAGAVPERFAVGAATLSLLSRFAEEHALLVLVEDAHLLDQPSAEALRFVARRLLADPIAILVATRPEPDALFGQTDLPTVDLGGLDLESAAALIAASGANPAPRDLVAELHRATAGNPLALVELSGDFDTVARFPPELPLPVPQTVARAFAQRAATLPVSSQVALLTAVVADGDLAVTARAAGRLGCDVGALADAEALGLLRLAGERTEFRHPLVRAAVYAQADPATRREVHAAVAAELPEAAVDQRAWHRSAAAIGPDDEVALAVLGLAERARSRGAHGVATIALARSAELTVQHGLKGERLAAAGESAWLAGDVPRATELLYRARSLVTDPARRAEVDGALGNVVLRTGSLREAYQVLTAGASHADADVAVQLLADAVTAAFYMCDAEAGLAAAQGLEASIGRCQTTSARIRGQMAVGIAHVLAGRALGVRWIRSAVESLSQEPRLLDDARRPDWTVVGTLFLRESHVGRQLVRHVLSERRARTAIGALPNLLFHTARDEATTQRWESACTDYDESIALARETGQTTDLAASLAGLAWLQARMGRSEQCRANAAEALALAGRHDITLARLWSQFALGDLALAAGDPDDAIRRYLDLQSALRSTGFCDVDVAPGPELAEAQLHRGDVTAAQQTAHEYLRLARDKGQPWALARAYRAVALCTPESTDRTTLFEKALEVHTATPDLFEQARTQLSFGAALRRAKSRVAARPWLRLALDAFDRLGAQPWADRTAGELEATGERARRRGEGHLGVLTSQEMRIAVMLSAGKTTKETAAALFLSPKTVEYHLRHIYQKLGIRSRGELTSAVTASARHPAG